MLKELGTFSTSDFLLLDFGCGEGWAVYHHRKRGIRAFGVGVINRYDSVEQAFKDEGIIKDDEEVLRVIDMSNYKIPLKTILLMQLLVIRFLNIYKTIQKR